MLYTQRFERGKAVTELLNKGPVTDGRQNGTTVRFKADAEIFKETTVYTYDTLQTRLREQAFLNAGVSIQLIDERDPQRAGARRAGQEGVIDNTYCYKGGLSSFVEFLNGRKAGAVELIHPDVIHFAAKSPDGEASAEVAMQYTDSFNELLLSFANNVRTTDGGTHEDGFKRALTRVMNDYAENTAS